MPSAQIFDILKASTVTDSTNTRLELVIQPQPTLVNGTAVQSPYSMLFTIPNPTAAQIGKYVYNGTITLTTDT